MDGLKTPSDGTPQEAALNTNGRSGRRRRWEMSNQNVRYFLPKPGTSPQMPELGQEVNSEADVLVKAFKDGGVFYTLVVWTAVAEIAGNEAKIIKHALTRS